MIKNGRQTMWDIGGARFKERIINNPCKHKDCINPHWQHGYCRTHWSRIIRTGSPNLCPRPVQCIVESCLNPKPYSKGGYCRMHLYRFKKGIPLELIGRSNRGENNPNWKGGIAEYPNHSEMKRMRLKVLKEANNICYYCGGHADRVHHLDKSKNNHSKDNLVASCCKCNAKLSKPHTSKFKRLYGKTFHELIKSGFFKSDYYYGEIKERLRIGI